MPHLVRGFAVLQSRWLQEQEQDTHAAEESDEEREEERERRREMTGTMPFFAVAACACAAVVFLLRHHVPLFCSWSQCDPLTFLIFFFPLSPSFLSIRHHHHLRRSSSRSSSSSLLPLFVMNVDASFPRYQPFSLSLLLAASHTPPLPCMHVPSCSLSLAAADSSSSSSCVVPAIV